MAIEYLTAKYISISELIKIFSYIYIHDEVTWSGTPCWIWTGGRQQYGHGIVRWRGRKERVHRLLWAWSVHPLPRNQKDGELDHLCRNPPCANPLHLEFVSSLENVHRGNTIAGINSRKTHCKRGHLFNEVNTYWWHGTRKCKPCAQIYCHIHKDTINASARKRRRGTIGGNA